MIQAQEETASFLTILVPTAHVSSRSFQTFVTKKLKFITNVNCKYSLKYEIITYLMQIFVCNVCLDVFNRSLLNLSAPIFTADYI